ncbi:MAG: ABC transporter ATP-binding protein [Planctomycetes bacterium]|nr:ABC transporter ATP-binding protein [Planctomycetota bacterium]
MSSAVRTIWRRLAAAFWGRSLADIPVEGEEEPAYRPIDAALVRRLIGWLRPYARRYSLGVALGVAMILLELLSPYFIGRIIAAATDAVREGAPADAGAIAVRQLLGIIGWWGLALAISVVLQRSQILIMTGAGERVQFDLRHALFAHLQKLSMSYYDRTRLGRIISRCTSDLGSLREINVWGLDILIKNALMMVFAATMLLATEPRLFLAVVWLTPILYAANRFYRWKAAIQHQIAREAYTRVATNLAENITGSRVVTAFHRQDWNLAVFNRLQEQNTVNNVQVARINGAFQPLIQLVGTLGRIIILLYGAYLVMSGRMPGGVAAVVTAFLYWDWFMNPILAFGNFHNQLLMAMAGAERIFQLLDTRPEVLDSPDAVSLPRLRGHVRFEGVTFGYSADRPVLHEVDFEAPAGRTVALVGPTGSGKSSIISLIARFYQPQAGRVTIDGYDLRLVSGESLHRQMGIVLQSNFLFSGTIIDNIRYARPQASDEDVERAARELGTLDAILALPEGLRTEVGERGASLSVGQRQLICFTRAFLADPSILILDEATSAIDTATESVERGNHRELIAGAGTYARLHRRFVEGGMTTG